MIITSSVKGHPKASSSLSWLEEDHTEFLHNGIFVKRIVIGHANFHEKSPEALALFLPKRKH